MSIWSSFCTFDRIPAGSPRHPESAINDPPYTGFRDGTGHYTTNHRQSLATTPRGGSVDLADSGFCELLRLMAEGEDGQQVEVWLDHDQVTRLAAAIEGWKPPSARPEGQRYGGSWPRKRAS